MKRLILSIYICCMAVAGWAQTISREYNDVSISDVLKQMNEQYKEYTISFMYNELEDFRVTTKIRNKSLPDAIQQMIGFYPIHMTVEGNEITVECPQKSTPRYKGTIVDQQNQPVAYANIALLSAEDSTLIAGGVSNESGLFVIPCEQKPVVARISYVGYKTIYKHCNSTQMGTIRLAPENHMLKGVVVKGTPQYKMTMGGMEIAIEGTLLAKIGSALDVLGQLPRVSVNGNSVNVFGKGAPLIYINNKKMMNAQELQQLKSEDIKSVEVITNPGAQYDAEVESVIKIKTRKRTAEGLSIRNDANVSYNKWLSGYEELMLKYQTSKFEIINDAYIYSSASGEDNTLDIGIHTDKDNIDIKQYVPTKARQAGVSEYLATDYWVNDSNSIGASYQYYTMFYSNITGWSQQDFVRNGVMEGVVNATDIMKPKNQQHTLNAYYQGKIGKMCIDLNGTYYDGTNERNDVVTETSEKLEDREVHSSSKERNRMYAAKLILDFPMMGGKLKVGTELIKTKSHGVFTNIENYVKSSETDIKEHSIAGFAQYELSIGHWHMGAGVRYEDVVRNYYLYGDKQDDASRTYHNLFPNLAVAWREGDWSWQLSMNEKMHRPSYHNLRNFMQYDNRYMYEGGNPTLRPEKVYNIETGATYRWISATWGYTYIKDAMVWVDRLLDNQAITYTSNMNFDHHQTLYGSIYLAPIFKIYRPTLELTYQQQIFNTKDYGCNRNLNKPSFGFKMNNRFVFSKSLMAGFSVRANTNSYDGFVESRGRVSVDAAIRKSFNNERWVVMLTAEDIFKTARERWTMYGMGTETTKNCYNYNRNISLRVTYNFNNTRTKYKGTGAGNEEKKRM